jgi:Flp pilus assembly protein TadG
VRGAGWGAKVAERRPLLREERGQATIELVAAVPALLLAALVSLQLLAAGYAITLADGAAEAGALALAEGGSAVGAARGALPGWAKDDVAVSVRGEEVSVRLRPPSPFGAVADRLAVTSTASARSAR